jgi:hypothetical protein
MVVSLDSAPPNRWLLGRHEILAARNLAPVFSPVVGTGIADAGTGATAESAAHAAAASALVAEQPAHARPLSAGHGVDSRMLTAALAAAVADNPDRSSRSHETGSPEYSCSSL